MGKNLDDETRDETTKDLFLKTLVNLRDRMFGELSRIDTDPDLESGTSEQRLKYLTGYFKTLREFENMVRQMQEKRDNGTANGIDVVEFRRQLEIQIERLVNTEAAASLSAETE